MTVSLRSASSNPADSSQSGTDNSIKSATTAAYFHATRPRLAVHIVWYNSFILVTYFPMSNFREGPPRSQSPKEIQDALLDDLEYGAPEVRAEAFSELLASGPPASLAQMLSPGVLHERQQEQLVMAALEKAYNTPDQKEDVVRALSDHGVLDHPEWVTGTYHWLSALVRTFGSRN